MEISMNIEGTRKVLNGQSNDRLVERLRSANARLQMQVNAANRKVASAARTEEDLAIVRQELERSRSTVAELTSKLKVLSAKLERKFKSQKRESEASSDE